MQLTTKQQYWLSHITAVQKSKQSMSAYAAHNNICVKALYSWKWQLKQLSIPASKNENPFIKITASETPVTMASGIGVKVFMPNGISLQLQQLTAETLNMLLRL